LPFDPAFTSFLLMAEAVEVFSASQNLGWDCATPEDAAVVNVALSNLKRTHECDPAVSRPPICRQHAGSTSEVTFKPALTCGMAAL